MINGIFTAIFPGSPPAITSDVSLVRGYRDEDYSQGLRLNFEPGDPFVILNHAVRPEGIRRKAFGRG